MSQDRSAEFLRGAVAALDLYAHDDEPLLKSIAHYRALLAAAEAREAGKNSDVPETIFGDMPTAAAVIAAAEKALASNVKLIQSEWFISDCPTNESPGLEFDLSNVALALIARWKEANGGKP